MSRSVPQVFRRALSVAAALCCASLWLLLDRPATADDVTPFCPPTPSGAESPTFDISNAQLAASWQLGPFSGSRPITTLTIASVMLFDAPLGLDINPNQAGDEMQVHFGLRTRIRPGLPGVGTVFNGGNNRAVRAMTAETHIDEIAREHLNIDWAQRENTDSSNQQLFVKADFERVDATLPAGTVTLTARVERRDSNGNNPRFDSYSLDVDTNGSTGAPAAWAPRTKIAAFLDFGQYADFQGLGLLTTDSDGAPQPWSDVVVGARVTKVQDKPVSLVGRAGFKGTLGEPDNGKRGSGSPGTAALASRHVCTNAVAFAAFAAGYNAAPAAAPAGVQPATFVTHFDAKEGTAPSQVRTYADATMTQPPASFALRFTSDGESIDEAPDDNVPDQFADDHIVFTRPAGPDVPPPSLTGVFSTRSRPNAEPLYAAFSASDLPPAVTADLHHVFVPGIGGNPRSARELRTADVRTCVGAWESQTCAAAPPLGTVTFTVRDVVPSDVDGNIPQEFDGPGPVPDDIEATDGTHFDAVTQGSFVRHRETGPDTFSLAGSIAGIRHVNLDLTAEPRVVIDSQGLNRMTAELDTDAVDAWAQMPDVPDHVEITTDLEDGTDGDPVSVTWNASQRTALAYAADLPRDPDASPPRDTDIRVAGWIGTGNGATDGLPEHLTMSLASGNPLDVVVNSSQPSRVDLGLGVAGAEERARSQEVVAHVIAKVTGPLNLYVRTLGDSSLERLDFTTCLVGVVPCGVVEDIRLTAARRNATPQLPLLVPVPLTGLPASAAFPQFPALSDTTDSVFAVMRTPAADDPVPTSWAVAVDLVELKAFSLRPVPADAPVPPDAVATDAVGACLTSRIAPRVNVGLYRDTGVHTEATYVNGTLERVTIQDTLNLQLQVAAAKAEVNTEAQADATAPVLRLRRTPCPSLTTHDADPAPETGGTLEQHSVDFSGRLRTGTPASILRIGAISGFTPVPTERLIRGSVYTAAFDNGTRFQGADIGFRLHLPTTLTVPNPAVSRCGAGGDQPSTCNPHHPYDGQTLVDVRFGMKVTGLPAGAVAALDITALTDDSRSNPLDTLARRLRARMDSMPTDTRIAITAKQRPRDGLVQLAGTVSDNTNVALAPVSVELTDDYEPARLTADGEPIGPFFSADQRVPNYSARFTNLASSLTVDVLVLAPKYGVRFPPYGPNDCDFDRDAISSQKYPSDESPSSWPSPRGPRRSTRPMYVNAEINMNAADGLEARVLATTDGLPDDDGFLAQPFDKGPLSSNRVVLKTTKQGSPRKASGVVHALAPGVAAHAEGDRFGFASEVCMDIDVPVRLEWTDLSQISIGIDQVQATITAANAEFEAGGDVKVSFVERRRRRFGGDFANVAGIWVEELRTWFNTASGRDYFTRIDRARKTVGIVDIDRPGNRVPPVAQTVLTYSAATGNVDWESQDRPEEMIDGQRAVWFAFDPFLHPTVEEVVASHETSWGVLWIGVRGGTRELPNRGSTSYVVPLLTKQTAQNLAPRTFTSSQTCTSPRVDQFRLTGARLSDGTTFELASATNRLGRVQLHLVARYPQGSAPASQVRFVRELIDANLDPNGCTHVAYTVDLQSTAGGRIDVHVKVALADGAGTVLADRRFVFDPSGNGGPLQNNFVELVTAARRNHTFRRADAVSQITECVWYPGDGTAHPLNDHTLFTYTYEFPGAYEPMKICWSPGTTADEPAKPAMVATYPGGLSVGFG